MTLILVIKNGSHFSVFWDLLTANSLIFVWKIKVFYQSFSCALFLSAFWTLTNIQLSSKLPFPQCKCLMLKKWRHRVISVKKKISCKSYLKLYLILIHHQTKLYGFFLFRKENGINSYFYITTKNQQFHEPALNFPG